MSFDREKVQFSDYELGVGEHADILYEMFKDGFSFDKLLQAIPHLIPVVNYFTDDLGLDPGLSDEEKKLVIIQKITALASMMERDNL